MTGRLLYRVLAGAILALLVALVAVFLAGRASDPGTETVSNPRLDDFAAWPALYQAMEGDTKYPVALSHIRGLSEVPSAARGMVVVNYERGTVTVSVEGLPALPPQAVYEALLVDNIAGPGNSVALDRGAGGDDIIVLGELKMRGSDGSLDREVGPGRLREFEVDMALVTRVMPGESGEFVVGGITSLFYKMGRRASLQAEELSALESSGFFGRTLSSRMTVLASGRGALSQGMIGLIEQGDTLFFQETFDGNGRTCGTCHRAEDNFALSPAFIATLPDDDLLFVAELNLGLDDLENPTLILS